MSDPAVAIVSLTVTEKGYCHDPATGELDENHPLIRSDLADPTRPRSAVGVLAAAIARRRAAGVAPGRLRANLPLERHAFAVAAWMRFVSRLDAHGVRYLSTIR